MTDWPKDLPLDLPLPGWLLSDATPEQYAAVQEDKLRWSAAVDLHNRVQRGHATKQSVWQSLKLEPEAYRTDMVRRLRALEQRRQTNG